MPDRDREHALLFACASSDPSPASLASIRSLAGLVDWNYVAAAAETHLVWPLVLANLQRANARLPDALISQWQDLAAGTMAGNLALVSQLDALFDLFDAQGIPAVTWKGPVLALRGYGSLSLRSSCDLDLLVPLGKIRDLRALMLANGYTLQHSVEWLAPRARHEFVFVPLEAGRSPVEAHPFVAEWSLAARLATDELIARGVSVTVAGCRFRTLCNEDTLLAIALHGSHHSWMRLRLIADVDVCARAVADWNVLVERASAARMRRILSVALLLAHDVLDTPVPQWILDQSRRDRTAVWLKGLLAQRLSRSEKPLAYPGDLVGFLSHERVADGLRYSLRQFRRKILIHGKRASASWRQRRSSL